MILVPYRLTLDAFCIEIPCDRELVVRDSAGRNGLNLQGSYPLHPLTREQLGGCESADHPKFARTAEGEALPVWFRLVRVRMIEAVLAKSRDLTTLIGDCGDEYRL
jgi:hypothetical protein